MISSIAWLPKGAAKPQPAEADPPSKEEIYEMIESGDFELGGDDESEEHDEEMDLDGARQTDDAARALEVAEALGRTSSHAKSVTSFDDVNKALGGLGLDQYDDEEDGIDPFGKGLGNLYYPSNEMDPYLKDNGDEDSEEVEDLTINPTDAVLVCARSDHDEFSQLEVWIYEDSGDGDPNMYVLHEINLCMDPLCIAWLDCPLKGGEKGNFIAVGSMEPSIEIWDLDIKNEVQPYKVLGGISEKKEKRKKEKGKKISTKYKKDSHKGPVLGLAWNKEYRNILASASADKRVKIWDVAVGKCNITMEHHTDKVQAVAWNHHAPQVLLSGSFDHTVVMRDGRMPEHSGYKWSVAADVESLAWDPHSEHSFVVSLEDGTVQGFDVRAATSDAVSESKPSFTLHAHDKAVCAVSYNPSAPNLLATGSEDKMVKLWDLSNNQPSSVASINPKLGAIFSICFSEDSPFLLAMGGSKGRMQVWDTLSDEAVSRRFGNHSRQSRPQSRP